MDLTCTAVRLIWAGYSLLAVTAGAFFFAGSEGLAIGLLTVHLFFWVSGVSPSRPPYCWEAPSVREPSLPMPVHDARASFSVFLPAGSGHS